MNRFEPTRFPTHHARFHRQTTSHRIDISGAPAIGPAQLANEFAALVSAPARNASRIIIQVDDCELIYILPQTGEVVTYGEAERN
jgi:hypothetical protein